MEAVKTLTDAELVANLRSGSRVDETIRSIYRDYFDGLSFYVIDNNGSRQDAEDIFQEVVINFIEIVQKDKFKGESTVKTFLFSLTRHRWLNELKRKGRALTREEKYEYGHEKLTTDMGQTIGDREAKLQVMDLINRLGDTCRKILVMYYYENLAIKDMLAALHYENEQVVRNKKYKCMKQLEEMLAADPVLKQNIKNLLNG